MRTFKNLTENVQEAITMPYGTDFNRPANPEEGMVRYNTTQDALEFYNGTIWSVLGDSQVIPNEVTDGLFGHWDADNPSSYNGSGTTLSDLTSNNYDLTLNNVTFNSSGIKYFDFNGSNSFASYTNSILKDLTSDNFTIILWVNWDGSSALNPNFILSDMATSGSRSISIEMNNGNYKGSINNGGSNSNTSTAAPTGTWEQITLTYNSTDGSKLYGNADLDDNNTNTPTLDRSNHSLFNIGRQAIGDRYFNGKIANIKIYNRTLSSDEVTQNFNAKKSTFGL